MEELNININEETVMWLVGTIIIAFNLVLCTIFAIMTMLAQKQHQRRKSSTPYKNKKNCIAYFFYGCVLLCTIQCLLCHYSILWIKTNPELYCRWAAPACLAIFFAAKACLYGFFLERAKVSQGLLNIFPLWLFKYILPIYIFLFWLIWTLLIMFMIKGGILYDSITSCIILDYDPWLLYTAAITDIFNTFLFLFLFVYPLHTAYMMNKEHFDNNIAKKKKFISMMWYNIVLSAICTISSFIYLFVVPVIYGYSRFGEQVDMMINSICVFFMMVANRNYVSYLCNKHCGCLCCFGENKPRNKEYEEVDTTNTEIEIKDIEGTHESRNMTQS